MTPEPDHQHTTTKPATIFTKETEWLEDAPSRAERAARSIEWTNSQTLRQTIRNNWVAICWVIYGQLACFGYGIDQIISASLLAVPKFREDFGEPYVVQGVIIAHIVPADWISIYSGVSQGTAIIGAIIAGSMSDRFGRRWTSYSACCMSLVGVGVQYAAMGSLPVLTIGKGLNGFATGAWLVLGPLYASEVSPVRLRAWLISLTSTMLYAGILVFTGVMYRTSAYTNKNSYLIGIACQWAVPSIIIMTIYWWPESPAWLLATGKREQAIRAIERLYGDINKDGILAEMEETLVHERAESRSEKQVLYKECWQGVHRIRTLTVMMVYGCQYFSGLIFVLGYQSYYFQLIGYSVEDSFLFTMLNNGLIMLAFPVAWYLANTIGRRSLIIFGEGYGCIWLLIIGGCSMISSDASRKAQVASVFLWSFGFQATVSSTTFIAAGEIPSLRLRAKTLAIGNAVLNFLAWLLAFCFPYMLNPDAGNLKGKVGFVFGGLTLVALVLCILLLPETKGRTTEEVDLLYKKKVKPWNFANADVSLLEGL